MDVESARKMEYAFIICKDVDARERHEELGTSMIVRSLHLWCMQGFACQRRVVHDPAGRAHADTSWRDG